MDRSAFLKTSALTATGLGHSLFAVVNQTFDPSPADG